MQSLMTQKNKDLLLRIGKQWAAIFFVAELIFFGLTAKGFFSINTFQIVLFYGTAVMLMAVGELFVIITGGIDLSVGYVMGLSTIISTKLIVYFAASGMPEFWGIFLGIAITLVLGLIPGIINGLLIARLQVPPFIATFSMLGISHGVSELLLTEGAAKNLPHLANVIGNGHFLYYVKDGGFSFFSRPVVARGVKVFELLPNVVVITFILVAIFAFILSKTVFGVHTYAIGGNEDSAIRSGINVKNHITKIYMLSSFLASSAGVLYMLKYVTGKADAGASLLLDSIAAVVIGGASLYGGKGTVWKAILGAVIIAVLETGLRILGIPTFDKYIMVGVILIMAVLIDQIFPETTYKE